MALNDFVECLSTLLTDEFVAKVERVGSKIYLEFLNGKKLTITASESSK